jgi:signal transduction histidine kinase
MNSEAGNLEKVAELLQEHHDDIGNFLTQDEQGKQIMVYLSEVSRQLNEDHLVIIDKLQTLTKNIDHIKHTVKMQQQYAKSSSVEIESSLGEIIDDAIQINLTSMERHQITLDRNIEDIGLTKIEKHKILQILVNLISNAKGALKAVDREDKKIRVCFYKDGDRLKIEISDNGIGISEENLTKIFRHGFTTRDEGHGFGLHSGWLAAKEMKGSLTATSQGPGKGATFTLELPYKPVEESVCG